MSIHFSYHMRSKEIKPSSFTFRLAHLIFVKKKSNKCCIVKMHAGDPLRAPLCQREKINPVKESDSLIS